MDLKGKRSRLLLDYEDLIWNEVHIVHTHYECEMATLANLHTQVRSWWVAGDIMSNPIYDIHSHELNRGKLLIKILVYIMEHMTPNCEICVIMISFSQPDWIGCKVQ
jgi:hypothetical protein